MHELKRRRWIIALVVSVLLASCAGDGGTAVAPIDTQDAIRDGAAMDVSAPDAAPDAAAPADVPLSDLSLEQIGDETPPAVEFVHPLDGAELEGLVAVEVDATDDSGVVSVELFVGGDSLGIDEEAPYEFEWDASELWSGTYVLKAIARDAAGNEGDATISVTVLGVCDQNGDCPPTVGIDAPAVGALLRGAVEIKASAGDDDAVVMVRFLVDGGLLLEDGQVPYKAEWDTTEFDDGPHALAAMAFDSSGKTTTTGLEVIVDNTPPEISLVSPEEGENCLGEVLFAAEASDDSGVDRVEFAVDGGEPEAVEEIPWELAFDASGLASGVHLVEATAWDAAGNEATATREFLVDRPPVVLILAPGEGAVVSGEVVVQAQADDDLGLAGVTLQVDGDWAADLVDAVQGLYEGSWNPPYEKGERLLFVTAVDSAGQEATAAVTVLVDHPVTVDLQRCVDEVCEALGPDTELSGIVQIRAVVADDGSEIVGVDFLVDGESQHQDLEAPHEFSWDTAAFEDGQRLLGAVATNALDETGDAQVQVQVTNCDKDLDGILAPGCGGDDCDDLAAAVHPCGDDLPGDGVDGNCDGVDALSCDDCDPCTYDALSVGVCVHAPIPEGGPCDDGDPCSIGSVCEGGLCAEGAPIECAPGASCVDGLCLTPCEAAAPEWAGSSVGCEFWIVDLDAYHDPFSPVPPDEADFGVVVGNPGPGPATVSFMSDASDVVFDVPDVVVQEGESVSVVLPRMDADGAGITDRSVCMTSTHPVAAYLCNPVDYTQTYSADCSLLLPATRLGTEYRILSYPTAPLEAMPILGFPSQHGYFTVVAVEAGNTVVAVESSTVADAPGGTLLQPGAEALYTLQQGEVLSFQADGSELALRDLSGSRVSATQKVAVFSGHEEAVVQPPSCDDGCCAEHIEEQLLPLAIWGSVVPCAKAPPRGPSDMDLWRIQAGAAGVVLTTSPPIPGLHGQVLAEDGDWVQAFAGASFLLEATGPIQVAQYLASQGCTEDFIGDPALVMAVPAARYRSSYVFATLEGYAENPITIVRSASAAVALDGAPLAGGAFQAVGSSGWEVGYFEVEGGAAHTVVGASPFGLYLYGYSGPASYGCPGGLDLVPDP